MCTYPTQLLFNFTVENQTKVLCSIFEKTLRSCTRYIRICSVVDPGCLFRIPYPDPHQRFKYHFDPKNFFSALGNMFRDMLIPDPDLDFGTIPDPGINKTPYPGSGSATLHLLYVPFLQKTSRIRVRNTAFTVCTLFAKNC